MSRAFAAKRFTFQQPDGSELQVLGWGNQFEAVFETLDGHTVVPNPATCDYHYATLSQHKLMLLPQGPRVDGAAGAWAGPKHLRTSRAASRERAAAAQFADGTQRRWETRRQERWAQMAAAAPFQATPTKKFNDYQITNMGAELTMGTFCHENGHMVCGCPDLYDYCYQSNGVGDYCLMCYGGPDKNPTEVCAFLKNEAGWASSVAVMQPSTTYALVAGSNNFLLHQRSATEYFILENRQRTGRDAGLPDAGLAIWHVDETGSNNNEQMTPARLAITWRRWSRLTGASTWSTGPTWVTAATCAVRLPAPASAPAPPPVPAGGTVRFRGWRSRRCRPPRRRWASPPGRG